MDNMNKQTEQKEYEKYVKEIWSQLDSEIFGMLNKSVIVNISNVESIVGDNVILQDGKKLYISRNYRKELKKKHFDYLRGLVWVYFWI